MIKHTRDDDAQDWQPWSDDMPPAEQHLREAIHGRTAWALRELVDKATTHLVVEEALWQMHLLARRRAIVALPGIGCALRLPVRQVLLAWRWLTGRDGGH